MDIYSYYYVYVLEEQHNFDLDKKSLASILDMITNYYCPRGEEMTLTVLCGRIRFIQYRVILCVVWLHDTTSDDRQEGELDSLREYV